MSEKKGNTVIRIELTAEQSSKIKAEIGRGADAIELTVEELEARITPTGFDRLASNHNETLLLEHGIEVNVAGACHGRERAV